MYTAVRMDILATSESSDVATAVPHVLYMYCLSSTGCVFLTSSLAMRIFPTPRFGNCDKQADQHTQHEDLSKLKQW